MSASSNSIVKSVYLENFQSHAKTNIDLGGPGELTVIVGPTDSGKTAIVRALRLLLYNVPQGDAYVRVGRDRAAVAVEMGDGTKVARERSRGSINRYMITKPGESSAVLEGFGTSVPLEVQEATGVRVVSIGETLDLALNLSEQLDGPFLGKSVSGPAKAKILGALAGTEEVDEAQRTLGTDLHRAGQEEKRLVAEVETLDEKIKGYDYLPGLAERIEALEMLLVAAKAAQEKLTALKATKTKLDSINAQRTHALGILARWGGLSGAMLHGESAEGLLAKRQVLGAHKTTLERIHKEHSRWFSVAYIRWAGLDAAIGTYEALEESWARKKALDELRKDLQATREGTTKCETALARWKGLTDAEAACVDAQEGVARLQALGGLSSRLSDVLDAQLQAGKQYGRWCRLEDAVQVASEVPTITERLSALTRASSALTETRQARVVAEDALIKHSKALTDAQSLYADTLISLGVCPTCGSKVSPGSIKQHIEGVA